MQDPSPGESSLLKLLSSLRTSMHPDIFVFLTYPNKLPLPDALGVEMYFQEREEYTIIATLDSAKNCNLDYVFPCRKITCEVHSSLEAVGFMAAMSKKLTERGIGANPVSGYYHDHLFVPVDRADEAVQALEELAKDARTSRE
ncbi:MAG: hypothetical protein LQ345_006409 [Seirophora villosa]|nr:MAG: hypothetical protein LQ345_006409 [Seirophora villosa]